MLNLNSTSIALKSLRITASQELASEDASGQSSSTSQAETGIKAKMLAVSGFLPFTQDEHLAQLFAMAEATESGARVIYRISNHTASALGVKQVRFSSKIEAVEQQTTRQWAISFTLVEYRSVPQKVEERTPDATANVQGGDSGIQYANINQHLTDNFAALRTV
ncbi:adenine glycosylase [Pseudoalteromonas sp. MelDa3]|uniref:baseplate complex protein n=1 Tax=Pseudoalteromonas sp. MelDa3 TaxID=888435 RepID=UPI000CC2DCCB|nr:adenine glycosylase [Pseudoalteromonas sp. MelDa3]PLT27069.1 adenine glycosylase [Pseudoalteromonas sp. MelDa3]